MRLYTIYKRQDGFEAWVSKRPKDMRGDDGFSHVITEFAPGESHGHLPLGVFSVGELTQWLSENGYMA